MILRISVAHLRWDIIIKMITKINISRHATGLLINLAPKKQLRANILARNALMLSLENGDNYSSEVEVDTSGKEFNSYTLFGSQERIFEMIIRHYYGDKIENGEWGKVINFHIEQGLGHEIFPSIFLP